MHGLFERPIANPPAESGPVPVDRYAPLTAFRLGNGKEAQRAAYDANTSIAKNLGCEERKPNNLHCQREGVVEQTHQHSNNETENFVGSERG
jgi:hypothetical protein